MIIEVAILVHTVLLRMWTVLVASGQSRTRRRQAFGASNGTEGIPPTAGLLSQLVALSGVVQRRVAVLVRSFAEIVANPSRLPTSPAMVTVVPMCAISLKNRM